jgi:hypothetical protein
VFVGAEQYRQLQTLADERGARGAAELLRQAVHEFLERIERRKASGG